MSKSDVCKSCWPKQFPIFLHVSTFVNTDTMFSSGVVSEAKDLVISPGDSNEQEGNRKNRFISCYRFRNDQNWGGWGWVIFYRALLNVDNKIKHIFDIINNLFFHNVNIALSVYCANVIDTLQNEIICRRDVP